MTASTHRTVEHAIVQRPHPAARTHPEVQS